jgi:hypothetical protein
MSCSLLLGLGVDLGGGSGAVLLCAAIVDVGTCDATEHGCDDAEDPRVAAGNARALVGVHAMEERFLGVTRA